MKTRTRVGLLDPREPMLHLGNDELGDPRFAGLANTTCLTMGGMPGSGKTEGQNYLLCQVARSPFVQIVTIDGLGGGNFERWRDRSWRTCGDDVYEAVDILEEMEELRVSRLQAIQRILGVQNIWDVGLSEQFPLIWWIIDECQRFFDQLAAKSNPDPKYKEAVARCIALATDLVRKGRQAGFFGVVASQKMTVDVVPSPLREAAAYGMSGAVRSNATAVAALGDDIREKANDAWSPRGLLGPENRGIFTVSLVSGSGRGAQPYTYVKMPRCKPEFSDRMAARYAHLYRDPRELIAA